MLFQVFQYVCFFFSEAQNTGIPAAFLLFIKLHVFFADIQQDMQQRPADAGLGHIPGLQKSAKLFIGNKIIDMIHNPVCQFVGDVHVFRKTFPCCCKKLIF